MRTSSAQRVSAEEAPVSFATLVGPTPSRQESPSKRASAELLAIVAHELRNPLTSLRLSLDMLLQDFDDLQPEAALRLVQRAQRSACWLQGLAENLTSVAAVEAGRLEVQSTAIDLSECVEDAIILVRGLLEQRTQSVRFVDGAPFTRVVADRTRVTQVLANLLSNASRYSVDGDAIELHVSAVGRHLRICVTDHGPGISPEDQERIFVAWERARATTQPGGLGLGLSIVRNLVQRLGGRVGVESTLGQGATFWFTLPVA